MAILAEYPMCHIKQATKNKACRCGLDLANAKKSKKVRYWISYRMPDGKQRREPMGVRLTIERLALIPCEYSDPLKTS